MRPQLSGSSAPIASQFNAFQPFPQGGLEQSLFPPSSRYHTLRTLSLTCCDGQEVAYLERRFLPDPDSFAELHEHTVVQGDRLDNLAYKYLGDPELGWRIADANSAVDPAELTAVVGRRLRITLPAGIPGDSRA